MRGNTLINTPEFNEILRRLSTISVINGVHGKLTGNLCGNLISIPTGINPSMVTDAMFECMPSSFFSGKHPCISHILDPENGYEDLLCFSDTLADADRLAFPFKGIFSIVLPSDIWNHTSHFEEVLNILQPVLYHVVPVFTVTDWDNGELISLGNRISTFFPVNVCHISLEDIKKDIITNFFAQRAVRINENDLIYLIETTSGLDYRHLVGICSGLASNILLSGEKTIRREQVETYMQARHELIQQRSCYRKHNVIGFR